MKGAQIKVLAIFPNVSSRGIVTHRSHVNILKTEQYHSFPISGGRGDKNFTQYKYKLDGTKSGESPCLEM